MSLGLVTAGPPLLGNRGGARHGEVWGKGQAPSPRLLGSCGKGLNLSGVARVGGPVGSSWLLSLKLRSEIPRLSDLCKT